MQELREIKLIMNNIFNNEIRTSTFYFKGATYELPHYFTSYKNYSETIKKHGMGSDFVVSKRFRLNKMDCKILNYSILNDTTKVYNKKEWFTEFNVKILTDSVTKFKTESYTKYIKPIFFRNNKRCFIAIYHSNYINPFFKEKI